jgi:hypothetical protein
MKNIHVLSTEKPSPLMIEDGKLFYSKNFGFNEFNETKNFRHINKQNIYITSDEKIKEGVDQWYLDKVLNEPYNSGGAQYSSNQDVIILTTDQELIKDGVQTIDDEFLEWFVNNPSCQEVKIERESHIEIEEISYEGDYQDVEYIDYKIIIPKEEPKQETIEEAAEKWCNQEGFYPDPRQSFVAGAKWQQKRSYSEEEVKNIVEQTIEKFYKHFYTLTKAEMKEQWFEQFKKK